MEVHGGAQSTVADSNFVLLTPVTKKLFARIDLDLLAGGSFVAGNRQDRIAFGTDFVQPRGTGSTVVGLRPL